MLYSSPSIDIYDGSIVTIGDDTTATVTIGGDVGADIDVQDADLTLKGNEIVIGLMMISILRFITIMAEPLPLAMRIPNQSS